MSMHLVLRSCLLAALLAWAWPAAAADPCPSLRAQAASPSPAVRIAAAACEEHRLWYRPFIDADGRIAGTRVREAEASPLANGQAAWQRVVDYWRGSGLLGSAGGSGQCASGPSSCRMFVVDTPWSAAFISWVMRTARIPGFSSSPSHVRYVRHAYRAPQASAWRFADPATTAVAQGDLLCYVRVPSRTFGFDGLGARIAGSDAGLDMHCDIVVGADTAEERVAYLVGGNVVDGVTMRLLRLAPDGRFERLPTRAPGDVECSPDAQAACNASRQDWAVLLQLRPEHELVALAAPSPGTRVAWAEGVRTATP